MCQIQKYTSSIWHQHWGARQFAFACIWETEIHCQPITWTVCNNRWTFATLTSINLEYMRKRKVSSLLLCRAFGHSPASNTCGHNHFAQLVWGEQEPRHTHTHLGQCWISPWDGRRAWWAFWVGFDPCSVWKQRGERSACGDTSRSMWDWGYDCIIEAPYREKSWNCSFNLKRHPTPVGGAVGVAELDRVLAGLWAHFAFVSHFICHEWKLVSNVLQTRRLHVRLVRTATHERSCTCGHDSYLQISSKLKLGWHQESSRVTRCFSRWLWPVTKDSANDNLFCRISGTHICRGDS